MISFKFSIVVTLKHTRSERQRKKNVKCVDMFYRTEIWLMTFSINTHWLAGWLVDRLVCNSLFQSFPSHFILFIRYHQVYFISHFFLMWFEILDLVIHFSLWLHHFSFQYFPFFPIWIQFNAKRYDKKTRAHLSRQENGKKSHSIYFFLLLFNHKSFSALLR